ncbi:hypothetical protein WICPIJ_007791 [Wickerhamomyces pijperi]|uniref:Uncharacterized protein n=1 Tax=Wickerhamomyces pijperi TaxID=599730 RepID=A0A9P8TJS8_WICPI|nr:hypothetical protein WICPIJ_007791 [Wickerhamomyces pijperi]
MDSDTEVTGSVEPDLVSIGPSILAAVHSPASKISVDGMETSLDSTASFIFGLASEVETGVSMTSVWEPVAVRSSATVGTASVG